jgi:spore coat protein U-like protein
MRRREAMKYTLVAVLVLALPPASYACTVSVQGVNFGSYDVFNHAPADSTGSVDVRCDAAQPYSIALSAGGGAYALRLMANGARTLGYNLFTDATRTSVWGDGTAGSVVVNGNAVTASHVVYGRIPARQNVRSGVYADSLLATITY